jgi:competence protein ComEC
MLLILLIINIFLCLNLNFIGIIAINLFISIGFFIFKDKKLIIFVFISLIMSMVISDYIVADVDDYKDSLIIEGKVIEYEIGNDDKFVLKTNSIKINDTFSRFKTKILITFTGDIKELIGKNIIITTKIDIPMSSTNPRMFNYKNYLASKGIRYTSYLNENDIINIEDNNFNCEKLIYNIRERLSLQFEKIYSGKTTIFIKGFIYGDKTDFVNEELDKFYEVGLGHILVVSGLHFGLIYLILSKIINQFQIPVSIKVVIITLVLFFMLVLTGFKISAIRAFIMIIIVESIYLIDRRIDILNLISFIAIMIIVFNPFSIYSLSFILSFGAIFSIALFYDIISTKVPSTLRLIISVQIILILINIYVFNRVNISSLLINIPTSFTVGILYVLIIINFVLYKLKFLTVIITKIIDLIFIMVNYFDKIEIFKFTVKSFTVFELFIILFVFFLIIYKKWNKKIRRIHIVFFVLISIVLLNTATLINEDLLISFFDVKSGDCSLVVTPHKSKILIDTGRFDNYNLIGDILLKNSIKNIDIVILTHNHTDHIGGMKNLLLNHKIKYLILSKESEMNEDMQSIFDKIGDSTKVLFCENGDEILIDGVKFLVINPVGDSELNENNQSIVLDLRYNEKSVLFTGDIEKETELNILKFVKKDYDVLKVCHHGSKTSSTDKFIDKASPKYSIIQVGKNSYGHPNEEVLERLTNSGSKIYRNDRNGCISVKINSRIKIETMKMEWWICIIIH